MVLIDCENKHKEKKVKADLCESKCKEQTGLESESSFGSVERRIIKNNSNIRMKNKKWQSRNLRVCGHFFEIRHVETLDSYKTGGCI
jgi:hypothetical protein